MAELDERKTASVESGDLIRGLPDSLMIGWAAIAVTIVCVVAMFISGFPTCCLFGLVTGLVLPLGAIAAVVGLFQKRNHRQPRLWQNVATLATIVGLLYLLTFGPGNPFGLLNLRMRGLVALTGGQEELQSWAVDLLTQPRDSMDVVLSVGDKPEKWAVQEEYWSKQIRQLRPKRVIIERLFEGDKEGVCLRYGGGFLHWYVIVGPPGSIPDPKLDEDPPDSFWLRWRDGVYCKFVP